MGSGTAQILGNRRQQTLKYRELSRNAGVQEGQRAQDGPIRASLLRLQKPSLRDLPLLFQADFTL